MERGEGSQWVKRTGGKAREDWGRTLEELEASGTVLPSFHGQRAGEGLILRDQSEGESVYELVSKIVWGAKPPHSIRFGRMRRTVGAQSPLAQHDGFCKS